MIIGQKFNEWTILDEIPVKGESKGQGYFYKCKCSCGAERHVRGSYLRLNLSKSCGCRGNKTTGRNLSKFKQKYKINETTDCWEWVAGFTRGGYGSFFYKGKAERAHRVSYEMYFGEFDYKLLVCHKCDNVACVNPEHLFLGSHKDNNQDMRQKNRAPSSNPKVSGELNNRAKLKNLDVLEIRKLSAQGVSKAQIGRIYNIKDSHICRIVSRKVWRHVL